MPRHADPSAGDTAATSSAAQRGTVVARPPSASIRRRAWLDRLGYYAPAREGIAASTRQAEALNIAMAAPPTSSRGAIVGQDAITGQLVVHDTFQAYADGLLTSPNVVVLGDVGAGKSSLIKTVYVLRQLVFGRAVIVIDKKSQEGVGEYAALARWLGAEPVRFTTDRGGVCLNPLDPAISSGIDPSEARDLAGDAGDGGECQAERRGDGGPAGQLALLRAILEVALARPVTPRESRALRAAHTAALRRCRAAGRTAVVGDVVAAILDPSPDAAAAAHCTVDELRDYGRDAAYELDRMIDGDLAGLVDQPTSPQVRLGSPLTVFDISGLPEDGPAIPITMVLIHTWLAHRLSRAREPTGTVFVVEEGWHLVDGPTARLYRRNTKLARGLGMSNVAALHHISDLDPGGCATALLKEAGTAHLFCQSKREDADACVATFDLPASAAAALPELPQGTHLLKIGSRPPLVVCHIRSEIEAALTNTDAAMLAGLGTPREAV